MSKKKYALSAMDFRNCIKEIGRTQYFAVSVCQGETDLIPDVDLLTAITRTVEFSSNTITWTFLVCEHTFELLRELQKIKPMKNERSGIDLSVVYLLPSSGDVMGKLLFKDIAFNKITLDFPKTKFDQAGGEIVMIGVEVNFSEVEIA